MANQNNTTAWTDLPNAKYIDMIMYSLKENTAWVAVKDTARVAVKDTARDAAYYAAFNAAKGAARDAACDAAYNAARDAAWVAVKDTARDAAKGAVKGDPWGAAWTAPYNAAKGAAWDAARALIAWDDCGYLLEETPEDVKMLALLGNQAAIMLYPACIALNKSKELEDNVTFA